MGIPGENRESLAVADGSCPDVDALLAYSSGKLAENELLTVARHVSGCETCERALRGLGGDSDPLAVRLREAVGRSSIIEESAFRRMEEAAKAIPRRGDGETDAGSVESRSMLGVASLPTADAAATVALSPPLPHTIGGYQVQSELGRGGFGAVYLARDPDLDRLVAIKVPKFADGASHSMIELFLAEARIAASLKHPGIISIHEVGRDEAGACYIVMEYVEGQSLAAELAKGKPAVERAAQIVAQAARAAHYAHKKGLVHRDLKPRNILLDAEGQVKIADFGLALHEDQQRARAGEHAGTLAYMSPEQIRGDVHRLDGRSDIWSLGVVLYGLLTDRYPFAGTPQQLADEIVHRHPKPPRQIDDTIPAELEQICLKCLAKEPDQRFLSAGDLAAALDQFNKPKSRPLLPRSPVIRWVAAALVLLGFAAATFVAATWLGVDHGPFYVDRVAKPDVPLPLLNREPEELLPSPIADGHWRHYRARPSIDMTSGTTALLSLGITKSAAYRLRVQMDRPNPFGDCGLFFDFRESPPANGPRCWQCQRVSIEGKTVGSEGNSKRNRDDEIHVEIQVKRELLILVESKRSGFSMHRVLLASVRVDNLPLRGVHLELAIVNGHPAVIQVGDIVLPELLNVDLPEFVAGIRVQTDQSSESRFGLINESGQTTFHHAEFELRDNRASKAGVH